MIKPTIVRSYSTNTLSSPSSLLLSINRRLISPRVNKQYSSIQLSKFIYISNQTLYLLSRNHFQFYSLKHHSISSVSSSLPSSSLLLSSTPSDSFSDYSINMEKVLDFWFVPNASVSDTYKLWYKKDNDFDQLIRETFIHDWYNAVHGMMRSMMMMMMMMSLLQLLLDDDDK